MRPSDTDAVFTVLRAADPDVMDRDELAELTSQLAAHQAWCDALKVRIARRTRRLTAEGRAEPARDLFSRHGRQSSKDAKAAAEREQVCTSLPAFEDALATGAVSAGHLDAIANATRNLDNELLAEFNACQADLLTDAERQGVERAPILRQLDTHHDPRPDRHLDQTRRHPPPHRPQQRPHPRRSRSATRPSPPDQLTILHADGSHTAAT